MGTNIQKCCNNQKMKKTLNTILQNSTTVDGTPSHIPAFISDLNLGVKVTQNIAQNSLHHVTYAPAKLEVAMSNSFGGDTFTIKIHYLTFDLGIKVT